ncbi:unnamed protein product [Strongylus vulgaris]|uniref:Uncharacterized protein n=1 Tax=Strongylus vulgaris TaxID=40348 RepID=A0A3P7JK47_STRVU|nr:unnamed protein product [Strongylus vulgaris]
MHDKQKPAPPVPFIRSDTDLVLGAAAGNDLLSQNQLIYSDPELQLDPSTSQSPDATPSVPEMDQGDQAMSDQSVHENDRRESLTVPK